MKLIKYHLYCKIVAFVCRFSAESKWKYSGWYRRL